MFKFLNGKKVRNVFTRIEFRAWIEAADHCRIHLHYEGVYMSSVNLQKDPRWQWLCEDFSGGQAWLPIGSCTAPIEFVKR